MLMSTLLQIKETFSEADKVVVPDWWELSMSLAAKLSSWHSGR